MGKADWKKHSLFSCRAKYAIGAIKRKVNDKNPHVALYALEVGRQFAKIFKILSNICNKKTLSI